jgi:hypothetical protein
VSYLLRSSSLTTAAAESSGESSDIMDVQVASTESSEAGGDEKTQLTTSNALHKTLLDIAHHSLRTPTVLETKNKTEFNQCINTDRGNGKRTAKRMTSLSPFTIEFKQQLSKSELQLEKELFVFWKNSSSSFDPNNLNVLARLGSNGRLQVHTQDADSYDKLLAIKWPTQLNDKTVIVHPPARVPPHHSIVIRNVPLSWQLPEIKSEIEERYGNDSVRNVVRMYAKAGKPIPSIRLDATSSLFVNSLLENEFVYIGYSRHIVKKYYPPLLVQPPCHNCHEIGHFARSCTNPKRCGRCSQQHDGECLNEVKCASCGGPHFSGQSSCPVVQRLREEKRQHRPMPPATSSYAAVTATHPKPSMISSQSSTTVIPYELKAQLDSINQKMDEVKNSFLCLSQKLTTRVVELETRLDEMNNRIDIVSSKFNYVSDVMIIERKYVRNSFDTILLPAIIDLAKVVSSITRSQELKKELETIYTDVRNAMNDETDVREEAIGKLPKKFPLLFC